MDRKISEWGGNIVALIYRAITAEHWLVRASFSLYLGWISVATIANLSAMQSALAWNNLGVDETTWTFLKLAVAGAASTLVFLTLLLAVYEGMRRVRSR
jgi:hypothetical protein